MRILYATDASAYRELPLAVAFPDNHSDIKKLIQFANANKIGLIPRTAGTSLAGQVVGDGIIVDVSQNFTKILELNKEEGWVRVAARCDKRRTECFSETSRAFLWSGNIYCQQGDDRWHGRKQFMRIEFGCLQKYKRTSARSKNYFE